MTNNEFRGANISENSAITRHTFIIFAKKFSIYGK